MNIEKIISELTLEEKASLCSGRSVWNTVEVDRLGIKSIMMTDGPHGLRRQPEGDEQTGMFVSVPSTCFPPASLSACSFDRELLHEMGEALGEECVAENVRILLGPGANIKRSPLCGRNFEYFSEDPYLAGEMAAAHIQGVQSKGVGTSLKHFAANSQETRRFCSDSRMDERTLNEIYLPAFKKAVTDAQPATIMCSYNLLNGEYVSQNHYLLTETLRDKWGFEGVVVSDWGAVFERVKSLAAGLELEMPGSCDDNDKKIVDAVRAGLLSEDVLDLAVRRLLTLLERIGGDGTTVVFDKEKHNELAKKIAAESMVLLKNNGILPLKQDADIVFIGDFAQSPRYQGAGSSQVNPIKMTSALEAAGNYNNVRFCKGYDTGNCEQAETLLEAEAVAAARDADVCVLFVGLTPEYESEGFDREHMRLPGGHNSLIEAVAAVNPNVVVVLHNGSPVEMPWADKTAAILEAYLGGQAGGDAVVDILFGKQNPCGKLAESFPKKLSDNPSFLYYFGERDVTEYREGIFVGYRYYDTKDMDVLFPFGHGLSYTTFGYSNLVLSASSIKDTDTLTVTVDVTNTGSVPGKEIVQLYVGAAYKDSWVIRAEKELKGFQKVLLQPGETKTVTFALDKSAFAYYNTGLHDWHVMTGPYRIQIGRSSRDIALTAQVDVVSTVPIRFKADVNTTFGDILRLEGGKEFIEELWERFPQFVQPPEDSEPGTIEYMSYKSQFEMVPRSVLAFDTSGMTLDQFQQMLDEKINK